MTDETLSSSGGSTMTIALIEEQADATIRREWIEGRWYFSVIDVVGVLTDAPKPRQYWHDMKRRVQGEGFREVSAKCRQLKMHSADGKLRETDAADVETMLRLIQSVPSPKAEPVKQWLARVGAERLDSATRPLDAAQASTEVATLPQPAVDAPAMLWAKYHEQLATLYYRQAAYEARLVVVDTQLAEHDAQLGEVFSRVESLEAAQHLLPELLERLGPQTLTPAHQAAVRAGVARLHDAGMTYGAVYAELGRAFSVAAYKDIPEARWDEVAIWFQERLAASTE
jgi:BRO family protein